MTTLYYLQSRYYDSELGRFINADALVSTGQGVLGNNMFAYCLNNPVNAGSKEWYKSGVTDNTYDDVMTSARANREVYCVITDAFGNQITTEVITLELRK